MKMNEPIGSSLFAPLLVRVPLGAYFLMAGMSKLSNISGFITEIKRFNIVSEHVAALYGTLLPYLEVGVGGFLLLGIWTTLASLVAALLLFSFIVAFGFFAAGGHIFNKDVVLLGGVLSLLYSGGGAYSVDSFRKSEG